MATPIRGDFGRLEDLIRRAAALQSQAVRDHLLKGVAEAARTEIVLGFERGVDPYGKTWAPLKARRGRRVGGQPLLDTGRLRSSFFVSPTPDGIIVRTNVTYAGYHQRGTRHMPARSMVPTSGEIGPIWRRAFERVFEHTLNRWPFTPGSRR